MDIDNDAIQSATIAIRAILEALACREGLDFEQLIEIRDDAKAAYMSLMFAQGFQPEKEYQ